MSTLKTPMMLQYLKIKEAYSDCILFYRMGDFYEMFLDDAKIGAKVLDIALTSRDKKREVPMAGVPYHAVDSYLAKMVKAGYKVAICEQVSEPDGKGLVDREVVRVVTPGTVLNEDALVKRENNYLMSLTTGSKKKLGIAVCDLSTGDFQATEITISNLEQNLSDELIRFSPAEVILPENLYNDPSLLGVLRRYRGLNIYCFYDWAVFADDAERLLKQHFNISTLKGFGIHDKAEALKSSAALLGYLKQTQREKISHLKNIKTYESSKYLVLDRPTIFNLELFSTIREGDRKGTLVDVLDHTSTAMGGRLLRRWILRPLAERDKIEARLETVEYFYKERKFREKIIEHLQAISDIERLISRLSAGLGNARDLVNLKLSLRQTQGLKEFLSESLTEGKVTKAELLTELLDQIDPRLSEVVSLIEKTLVDEPAFDIHQGGMIREGVSEELDELLKKLGGGREWLKELEQDERERTGINSLKVKFNKVFGYYIEVSKANLHLVPGSYHRKQTLVNAERFVTPELKEYEDIVLTAGEKARELEYKIFMDVVEKVLDKVALIQNMAESISVVDCLVNFAELAHKNQYSRPKLLTTGEISIREGRHPVVEQLLDRGSFVPNDVTINSEDHQILLVTGPNMAGKSVLMRQVALTTLMAQMGCFVPATEASINVADRLFVRSGASDIITSNLSTFMVEMVETANILIHATKNSLVILDEIGRGTSTYDGLSLAWAVVEYLASHPNVRPKTLFATHYHELQVLADRYDAVQNYQMLVEEKKGELNFLYKMSEGGASHSYGIAVASLAGIPREIIRRSIAVLKKLEEKEVGSPSSKLQMPDLEQMSLLVDEKHPVLEELKGLDVENLTPLEALKKLVELKEEL